MTDKTDKKEKSIGQPIPKKSSEERKRELRKHLNGRAVEYFMFPDDEYGGTKQ